MRERLLTVILKGQIHESENLYDWQAQLDKVDLEMQRRHGGLNFQRCRLPAFFYKDDDIMSISTKEQNAIFHNFFHCAIGEKWAS